MWFSRPPCFLARHIQLLFTNIEPRGVGLLDVSNKIGTCDLLQ